MSNSPESVRNTSVSDQPTGDDSLGFSPYVTAIAEFLLNEQTKPPLTLSIEGEWGSGKSSFMKQLEAYLREKGGKTVWFNAWRHDKAEAVWAAFALSFIKQISTPKEYTWQAYEEIFWGHVRLAIYRFDLKKGWLELLQIGFIAFFVICAAFAIPLILAIYGMEGINLFWQALTHPGQLLQAFLYLLGIAGGGSLSLAGLTSLLKKLPSIIGGPKFNLIKYLKSPDYAKQSAFIEEFHEDFTKIVDAYVGDGRVYVFIDDLDRCEHPKSADLMQAMNLMIDDNPSVVFILGMDREKVAASLAVKYENVLRYLPSENSDIDPDILERYSTNKGLAYGYTFIEKFIQLPFQVPQPSSENFEKFFAELGTPQKSESDKFPPSQSQQKLSSFKIQPKALQYFQVGLGGILPSFQWILKPFQGKIEQTGEMGKTGEMGENLPPDFGELLITEETQQQAIEIKRSEIIQLSFDSDSPTVHHVLMMVAPALDYNPRRIKQFINLFRLKVSIAYWTGLFDRMEDSDGNVIQEPLTFEQLGKFVAINLRWPLFLLELENDPQLFKNFYNNKYNLNIGLLDKSDLHSKSASWGWEEETKIFRYWLSQDKFRKLLAYGYGYQEVSDAKNHQVYTLDPKFSLAEVNIEKLLQVSPKVVRSTPTLDQQIQTALPKGFNLEMVDIPAGKFLMGSDEYNREKPVHEVTVPAFKMSKYPVTQAQYEAVMETNPSGFSGNPNNPVEQVSWFDAQVFCKKLSQSTGQNYRLPTEAEWEYACRAWVSPTSLKKGLTPPNPLEKGAYSRYCFGDDESLLGDYAWFDKNSDDKTHPVGEKLPNAWGLYDMHGNVLEWCADYWHVSYADKPDNCKQDGSVIWSDSNVAGGSPVVVRGGSWGNPPRHCRSSSRNFYNPVSRRVSLGFRVVCEVPRS